MSKNELKDQEARDIIQQNLDTTMLVEASAGTGKTTALTSRMVSLIKNGRCNVDKMVAITFTKKAAAELRTRFQICLEKSVTEASDADKCDRLKAALLNINDCFIGTIHSFCSSLLRERPVEAGVPIGFKEIDEMQDNWLKNKCWQDYTAGLFATNDKILDQLDRIGVPISHLQDSYKQLCRYSDIDDWPMLDITQDSFDCEGLSVQIGEYILHINTLTLPKKYGTDTLIPIYNDMLSLYGRIDTTNLSDLMRLIELCKADVTLRHKFWGGKEQAESEKECWKSFITKTVLPAIEKWFQYQYTTILPVLKEARNYYEQQRKLAGQLNFNDLLLKAAGLLKDNPHIRKYFKKRYTHLLVDEFQDTDPIQAKIMLYLTASNLNETDWTKCKPENGSLFVVGDPKQSIYRFRRADIMTYSAVKTIIEQNGIVLNLTTNFRSTPELISWFNDSFERMLPDESNMYSPAYAGFTSVNSSDKTSKVMKCTVSNLDENINHIASFIQQKIKEEGASYGDFMVLTRNNTNLGRIASELRNCGISCNVKNGSELNASGEFQLLSNLLKTLISPDDPVALVCLLRSPLAGFSDTLLYDYKKAGGYFRYYHSLEKISFDGVDIIKEYFSRLRRYREWLLSLPCVSALKMIIDDIGLNLLTVIRTGDNNVSERFQKILELVSTQQGSQWSTHELVVWLETQEKLDMPVIAEDKDCVRLLNIHNAKGLEAKYVFLADITGNSPNRKPFLHVDRTMGNEQVYLAITIPNGKQHRKIITTSPKWDEKQAEEKKFEDAEKIRLLYVAATRAMHSLIVTMRQNRPDDNVWQNLGEYIDDKDCLTKPTGLDKVINETEKESVTADDLADIAKGIKAKWNESLKKTFDTGSVKEITVAKKHGIGQRKHGEDWGTLVHSLLEKAMRKKDVDLISLSELLVKGTQLSLEDANEAVEHVKKIKNSKIWSRAVQSEKCLTEVPYYVKEMRDGVATIINGVVDLAFREADNWILVDYKTDSIDKEQMQEQVGNYAPQIQMYADHWTQITKQKVSERGLYFTHLNDYVTVGKE